MEIMGYLGGSEGYTASACDGSKWFDQLFWLGVNRAPAGWHKWTFDFDAEAGLEIFHNDHALSAVDSGKTGLRGFSAIAAWGDQGQGHEQTVWLDDLSATLGGPVRLVSARRGQPVRGKSHEPGCKPARHHLHQGERAGRTAAHGPAPPGEGLPVRNHLDFCQQQPNTEPLSQERNYCLPRSHSGCV